jgi:hypothetical protein
VISGKISKEIDMRTAGSVLCVFALTFPLDAQITTTLKHLPDGLDEVRIRNNSANRLVAFVVAVKQVPLSVFSSNAPFAVYSDPLIEPAARPLMASEERVVMSRIFQDPSGRWRRLLAEPIASAGIFADGTTAGDAALLTRLIIRRSSMLQAVETALETLSGMPDRS